MEILVFIIILGVTIINLKNALLETIATSIVIGIIIGIFTTSFFGGFLIGCIIAQFCIMFSDYQGSSYDIQTTKLFEYTYGPIKKTFQNIKFTKRK